MAKILNILGYFALLTVLIFAPFFLKGQIPFPGNYMLAWYEPWHSEYSVRGVPTIHHKPVVDDAFRHLYPLRELAMNLFKNGQLPLWNPYNAAGTPLLAILHPGYFNPFGVFYFFFSAPIAWSLYIVFQIPILGLAFYLYCRLLKCSEKASLFSSSIFLLSAFSIVRLEYGEFLYTIATLPLLLGVVEKLRNDPASRFMFAIPFLILFAFLSGQPQMTIYVVGFFAVYSIIRLWSRWGNLIWIGVLSIFGFGLGGFQLLASLELYRASTITQQTSQFIFRSFLLPFRHLVTIAIPNYFGNQGTYNFFGPGVDYVETAASVGLIGLFFALLGLLRYRKNKNNLIVFYAAASILLPLTSVNWFGARFLWGLHIPVLSSDVPSRIFVLSTFCFAILSGFGYQWWEERRAISVRIRIALWAFAFVILIIVGITFFIWLIKVPCPVVQIPECRLISVRNTSIEVGAFLVAVLAFIGYDRLRKGSAKFFLFVPIVLLLLLGLYNAYKFLPFSPKENIFPETALITKLKTIANYDRFFGFGTADFRSNLMTHYGLFSPEYFDPLHLGRYAQLVDYANTGSLNNALSRSDVLIVNDATPSADVAFRRQRLFDIVSVKYFIFSTSQLPLLAKATKAIWQDRNWYVTENTTSLPRTYLVSSYEVKENDADRLSRLFDPTFNPRHEVILEETLPETLFRNASGSTTVTSYGPNRVEIAARADGPVMLVLTDTFYPGWKVTIDGLPTKIYRANYTFRAVMVPRGQHAIVFSYEPQSLPLGTYTSLASVIGVGILFFFLKRDVLRK